MLKNRLFGAALLFLVSSVGAFAMTVNQIIEMGWSKALATVVLTQVSTKESKKNFDVVYRFKIDNTNYVKKQNLGAKSADMVEELKKKYAKNATIDVIFDPKNPKNSKIKNSKNFAYLFFAIAFPVTLLLASLILFKKSIELHRRS